MKKAALLTAYIAFLAFNLLTALYCLLAYLPFTYHQIQTGHLVPWLDAFARNHPLMSLAMLGGMLGNLIVLPLLLLWTEK